MAAQQQISKGLATWAGLVAAAGQYAGAVAVFLNDPDKATALGPLTTATVTLVAVIYGRMSQAKEAVKQKPAPAPAVFSGSSGTNTVTQTTPRPSVDISAPIDPFRRAPDAGTLGRDDDEEPGDEDALPDYGTTTVVPPDEGDRPPEAMS
jgi:hypothetical protein